MKLAVSLSADPAWLERVVIRLVTAADLPALEWEGEYVHFRRVYDRVFARMQSGQSLMWLAELPGSPALGQVFVQLHSQADPSAADGRRRAYIHAFRVRRSLRGRGLGSRLLAHAEADLLGRGFREVCLQVADDNPDALRLYQRLGYAIVEPVAGDWTYYDHLGRLQQISEVGWRLLKTLHTPD